MVRTRLETYNAIHIGFLPVQAVCFQTYKGLLGEDLLGAYW